MKVCWNISPGGGWCESLDDCLRRSATALGSSSEKFYPQEQSMGGGIEWCLYTCAMVHSELCSIWCLRLNRSTLEFESDSERMFYIAHFAQRLCRRRRKTTLRCTIGTRYVSRHATVLLRMPSLTVFACLITHKVFLVYCDGGSFSGTLTEPIHHNGTDLYFSGFYNLNAILDDLAGRHGLFNVSCCIFVLYIMLAFRAIVDTQHLGQLFNVISAFSCHISDQMLDFFFVT